MVMSFKKSHCALSTCHQPESTQFSLIWSVGLAAAGADPTHQTLGHDADQGGGDHEGFHSHFIQSGDGARCVIGMQGAQHQMSGESSLDCGFGCLQIAGFFNE